MNVKLVTVEPTATVQLAVARMLEEEVGGVAVCEDGGRLVGIFTERDVLRLAGEGPNFREALVRDVMTPRPVALQPDDDILAAAKLMGERRIRHVPVVQGEHVLGMIGIRDVLGTLIGLVWRTHDERAHETVRDLLSRR